MSAFMTMSGYVELSSIMTMLVSACIAHNSTRNMCVCVVVAWSIEVTRKWQRASGGLLLVAGSTTVATKVLSSDSSVHRQQ